MVKILEDKRLISDQILTVPFFSMIKKVFDNFLIMTKIFKGFTLFMILIFGILRRGLSNIKSKWFFDTLKYCSKWQKYQ